MVYVILSKPQPNDNSTTPHHGFDTIIAVHTTQTQTLLFLVQENCLFSLVKKIYVKQFFGHIKILNKKIWVKERFLILTKSHMV